MIGAAEGADTCGGAFDDGGEIGALGFEIGEEAVAVALGEHLLCVFVTGVEEPADAAGLIADKLGLAGGAWDIISAAAGEIGVFGYAIVALFVLSWLVSLLAYRLKSPHKIGA